ncbi:MAG: hypothetical protein VKJ09_06740 [Leptolyngbya sp.]|nr:hypothetical protein [Leptolyngbya sp.]
MFEVPFLKNVGSQTSTPTDGGMFMPQNATKSPERCPLLKIPAAIPDPEGVASVSPGDYDFSNFAEITDFTP